MSDGFSKESGATATAADRRNGNNYQGVLLGDKMQGESWGQHVASSD